MEWARESPVFARHALSGDFNAEAGRAAYIATFHAAQAFIIVRTGDADYEQPKLVTKTLAVTAIDDATRFGDAIAALVDASL